MRVPRSVQPFVGLAVLTAAWEIGVRLQATHILPGPLEVVRAIGELTVSGMLFRHVAASLFRVTWGWLAAVLFALPVGVWLGLFRRLDLAWGPQFEILRPISPLAWIPIAILWFGVGDLAAVMIIFLASFLPLVAAVRNAVRNISPVHLQAGRNFGLGGRRLVSAVILPAILPQTIVALRLSLGIAWLVVVAAEMIAVNSGLGFLIVDARNAGNRYDLVVAGMVLIGLIGLGLDIALRRLERDPALRWGLARA